MRLHPLAVSLSSATPICSCHCHSRCPHWCASYFTSSLQYQEAIRAALMDRITDEEAEEGKTIVSGRLSLEEPITTLLYARLPTFVPPSPLERRGCLPVCLLACMCTCLPAHPCVHPPACPPVCLSLRASGAHGGGCRQRTTRASCIGGKGCSSTNHRATQSQRQCQHARLLIECQSQPQ